MFKIIEMYNRLDRNAVESNGIPNVPQSHLPVLVLAARTPA